MAEQANQGLFANMSTRLSTYLSLRHAWREPAKREFSEASQSKIFNYR